MWESCIWKDQEDLDPWIDMTVLEYYITKRASPTPEEKIRLGETTNTDLEYNSIR